MKLFIFIVLFFASLVSLATYSIWLDTPVSTEIVYKIEVTQPNPNGRGNWKPEIWLLSDGNCVQQFTDVEYPKTMYKITKNSGEVLYATHKEDFMWKPIDQLSWRN